MDTSPKLIVPFQMALMNEVLMVRTLGVDLQQGLHHGEMDFLFHGWPGMPGKFGQRNRPTGTR
jgi:hypothetical protein